MVSNDKYPRPVEEYKGLTIWFNPQTGKYYVNLCEHVNRDPDIRKVKAWLDRLKS